MLNRLYNPIPPILENPNRKHEYGEAIAWAEANISKNIHLRDAIYDFIGDDSVKGGLATLVGELVLDNRMLGIEIDRLVNLQEKENENG